MIGAPPVRFGDWSRRASPRLRFVSQHLNTVHPGVSGEIEAGAPYVWREDPWARGAYATLRPGQLTHWLPIIARPEGRVHFAGEHTSVFPKTIEGALESGVRAAREIMRADYDSRGSGDRVIMPETLADRRLIVTVDALSPVR